MAKTVAESCLGGIYALATWWTIMMSPIAVRRFVGHPPQQAQSRRTHWAGSLKPLKKASQKMA
eukprot:7310864-Prymnesium_polylepis.1